MTLQTVYDHVLAGNANDAVTEAQAALDAGTAPEHVLYQGCIPAMDEMGRRFESGDAFIPEMLVAARAMQAVMNLLRPLLVASQMTSAGTVVIGTVKGDIHDIGKNLVGMMLEGSGFQVIDLGANVPPERFVEAVQQYQPNIVGMSALLTTTMMAMKTTIQALTDAGLREQVKVVVGGAPITQDFAAQIGADGYAPDAARAPRMVKQLLGVS